MKILGDLGVVLLGLASTTALLGQVDAREIIRHAVAADELNWRIARDYTFLQRVELRHLDAQGRVKLSEVQTYDVTLQDGTPYRQLVQRDDRPLPPAEERKEQESLAKSIAERRQETEAERAKRLSAYERRPDWQREAWHELPDAFDFRLVGEETSGWPQRLHNRGHAAPGIPAPIPHRQVVSLAQRQVLGGPTRPPDRESGSGGHRHHLGGVVPGPRRGGITRDPGD